VPLTATAAPAASSLESSLDAQYRVVRSRTETLCAPLAREDYVVQSMPDVSPTKWHLAHTTWFFETFVLVPHAPRYRVANPEYAFLFNSYYVQAGARHARASRGYISRPTVDDVFAYRRHVDGAMAELLGRAGDAELAVLRPLIDIGLNHEQQHQELMLTDIKHVLSVNPLRPAYRAAPQEGRTRQAPAMRWVEHEGGVHWIGHEGSGFAYDNESPRHRVWLEPFALGSRLVTNAEYRKFIDAGGYDRAELWLSLGWAEVEAQRWRAPFYWEQRDGEWWMFTLAGMRRVVPDEPVCHVSYFEADAYARWAGCRLPTEAEWEHAAATAAIAGNFVESERFHPAVAGAADGLQQLYGDVWEWTQSSYSPYPGFRTVAGALGEYNGKFMCNQYVLRGGSCATPVSHIRPTYRNFFPPGATWQFSGIRLARDP
jgi:ergothioneine biosynthesis protein EgtB